MGTHSKNKKSKQKLSQSNRESIKQKKKQRIISLILVLFMLGSLVGIGLSSIGNKNNDDGLSYGDYRFSVGFLEDGSNQQVIYTEVDGMDVYFYYLPRDVERVSIEGNLSDLISKSQLIVMSSNPEDNLATYYDLIRYELSSLSNKQIIGAVPETIEGIDLPVVTCDNASSYVPVLSFYESNESSIVVDNNCVDIKLAQQDVAIMRDRLLYAFSGIIKE